MNGLICTMKRNNIIEEIEGEPARTLDAQSSIGDIIHLPTHGRMLDEWVDLHNEEKQ
jgi:hypothetical protein